MPPIDEGSEILHPRVPVEPSAPMELLWLGHQILNRRPGDRFDALGGERTEIDDLADQRLHVIFASLRANCGATRLRNGCLRGEEEIDVFGNFISNRLERDNASLAHSRGNPADNPQAAALPVHVEIGFETRQVAQPRRLRYRRANLAICRQVEVLAQVRHVFDRNRKMPWAHSTRLGVSHG